MASDLGVLLPTESQYGNPGAYTEAIRAEATKQATYLSNMDQFYAQLDESKRQFDLNYSAREKEFDWTSKFEEKKLSVESGFAERKLVLEEKAQELTRQIKEKELQFAETQLGFQKETLGFEREKLTAELEKMRQEIGLAEKGYALQEKLGLGSLDVQRYTAETQGSYNMGMLNLQQQNQAFTQQLQSAQFGAALGQAQPNLPSDFGAYKYYGSSGQRALARWQANNPTVNATAPTPTTYSSYTPSYQTSATSKYMQRWS